MIQMHTYVMKHTAKDGKVTIVRNTLGGDVEARYWGKLVVERDGGSVMIQLQDGTIFTWP